MISTRLGPGGRVTLPLEIRSALGVAPGDTVAYEVNGDGTVRLRKAEMAGDDHEAAIQAAIEDLVSNPGPSHPAEEALARVYAHMDARSRDLDAA